MENNNSSVTSTEQTKKVKKEHSKAFNVFTSGILKDNPVLVMLLGLCPVIPATTSIINALMMTIAVLFVLLFSNIIISSIKKIVPNEIRIPIYIVIIATLVTIVDLLLKAFAPDISESLGVFIPLITVNCIILGRGEAFASKNTIVHSILDALGMAIGFGIACVTIAFFRELLGTGGFTLVNPFNAEQKVAWLPLQKYAASVMVQGIGGFLTFGLVIGVFSLFLKTKVPSKNSDTALKNTFTTLHDIVECQKSERRVK